jgi:hypothetical protein
LLLSASEGTAAPLPSGMSQRKAARAAQTRIKKAERRSRRDDDAEDSDPSVESQEELQYGEDEDLMLQRAIQDSLLHKGVAKADSQESNSLPAPTVMSGQGPQPGTIASDESGAMELSEDEKQLQQVLLASLQTIGAGREYANVSAAEGFRTFGRESTEPIDTPKQAEKKRRATPSEKDDCSDLNWTMSGAESDDEQKPLNEALKESLFDQKRTIPTHPTIDFNQQDDIPQQIDSKEIDEEGEKLISMAMGDDEEDELQRALALSLENNSSTRKASETSQGPIFIPPDWDPEQLRKVDERFSRKLLREEQNREFQESLRIDQEKEREKMEEERLLLEEKERIQAEELRKRKEEEETEQNHELLYQNLKRRFDEKEKSDLATGDRKQVRLALRLANGERVQRNFFVDEQLEEVQLYTTMKLLEKDRSANINFVFVSDFPRRVFRNFAGTLEECELDRPTLLNVSPE